jgi:cell division control protein 6
MDVDLDEEPSAAKVMAKAGAAATATTLVGAAKVLVAAEDRSPHALAHAALSRTDGSSETELVGREAEATAIRSLVTDHVRSRTSASLYISGKPGTGKTATVTATVAELEATFGPDEAVVVKINCMTTAPRAIYTRLLDEATAFASPDGGRTRAVGGSKKKRKLSAAEAKQALDKKHLLIKSAKSPMLVLVLDEIDQLETSDNNILYTVFAWAHRAHSAVILLGIANGLDLTERVLPMLKGRGCSPALLNFAPYTKEQLVDIVKHRLAAVPHVGGKPILDHVAIGLCAAKVTSVSGDLRNCLDVCKHTVALSKNAPPGTRQLGLMMQVFKSVLGTDSAQRMRTLPMHQKVALCALHRLDLQGRDVAVGTLHAAYRTIATEKRLQTLRQGFYEMLALMACSGLIDLTTASKKKTTESREARVRLRGLADDIKFAFAGDAFLSSMLGSARKPAVLTGDDDADDADDSHHGGPAVAF